MAGPLLGTNASREVIEMVTRTSRNTLVWVVVALIVIALIIAVVSMTGGDGGGTPGGPRY
ncbi:MAG: hypothetical protein L0Y54_06305 [Sporichthyaceae bacterium]|nr:hypothetical protein [Sporichthyaceae bacterium]